MEEFLKKFVYTGVGLLSLTTTKMKEVIENLINDRKITEDEGKRLVDDFLSKTKQQRKEFEEQLRTASSNIGKEFGSSLEETDETIKNLQKRIEELEKQLKSSGPESANPHSAATSATADSSGRISMEGEETLQEAKRAAAQLQDQYKEPEKPENPKSRESSIDKVKHQERVSLSDEVLTPEKKMEAEKQRMQEQQNRPSAERKEEDTQKENLGGPALTPDKKMEQARQQSKDNK